MNGGQESEGKPKGFSLSLKGVTTKKSAFDRNLVRDVEIKEETDLVTESKLFGRTFFCQMLYASSMIKTLRIERSPAGLE